MSEGPVTAIGLIVVGLLVMATLCVAWKEKHVKASENESPKVEMTPFELAAELDRSRKREEDLRARLVNIQRLLVEAHHATEAALSPSVPEGNR